MVKVVSKSPEELEKGQVAVVKRSIAGPAEENISSADSADGRVLPLSLERNVKASCQMIHQQAESPASKPRPSVRHCKDTIQLLSQSH